MMSNSQNDREKHVEAFEAHLQALWGEGWEGLTAKEVCKLLAVHTLGLNGGPVDRMADAANRIGFDSDNIVHCGDGSYQVLTMVEFADDMVTAH